MDHVLSCNGFRPFYASEEGIAECLGWPKQEMSAGIRELIVYVDRLFQKDNSKTESCKTILGPQFEVEEGMPFYATANQYTLYISRRFVDDKPVFQSDYTTLQASEDYQYTLQRMIRSMIKSQNTLAYVKVTDFPRNFDMASQSIVRNSSAECDIFLPTGMCKGLSSRNGKHITDNDVFAYVVKDYVKIMRKLQKHGFELITHFYLVKPCEMNQIQKNPAVAKALWDEKGYRDYREITIAKDGEIQMHWRQENDR